AAPPLLPYTTLFRSSQCASLPPHGPDAKRLGARRARPRDASTYCVFGLSPTKSALLDDERLHTGDRKLLERMPVRAVRGRLSGRSEEHTSELQSRFD